MLDKSSKVFVAGHRGMVGSAIVRKLRADGYENILMRSHIDLDLVDQQQVRDFMRTERPDYVVLAAAKVGGMHANNVFPAEFIYQNLMMESNVIHESWSAGIENILFLGSSCIYPKLAQQPMQESELLTGLLEPTNEPYAIAKIAGIKICESYNRQYGTDYRSAMPTNLYGTNDNFHPENSHVIPALMRKFHEAVQSGSSAVKVWGTGKAMREFLHVDDMAAACLHIMELDSELYQQATSPMLSHVNIGTGQDVTIRELAEMMGEVTGFGGEIVFDSSKPDGTPRKLMDVSKLHRMGWKSGIDLRSGLNKTYEWFVANQDSYRK